MLVEKSKDAFVGPVRVLSYAIDVVLIDSGPSRGERIDCRRRRGRKPGEKRDRPKRGHGSFKGRTLAVEVGGARRLPCFISGFWKEESSDVEGQWRLASRAARK